MEWWVYRNGTVSDRPLTRRELREKEYVDANTYVCRTGQDSWIRAGDDPELEELLDSEDDSKGLEDLELDEEESSGPRATPAFNVDHTSSTAPSSSASPSADPPDTDDGSENTTNPTDGSAAEREGFHNQGDVIARSLWKRPFAFAIDYGLFYLFFWVATRYYHDPMLELESTGIVLGHSVFLLYLAVFNSDIGGSSTFGKKLLGLRVYNEEGFSISFFTAFWRSFLLLIPLLLFSLVFTDIPGDVPDVVHVALVMLGLFVGVALIYLFVFNRYRRSFHDCLTSTAVVKSPPRNHLNFSFWRPHLYFIGVFFALGIYGLSVLFAQYGGVVPMLNLQQSLLEDPRILATEVPVYLNYTRGTASGVDTLYVNVWVKDSTRDMTGLKRDILDTTFRQSMLLDHFDTIRIGIATGVDFGLFSEMNYRYDRRTVTAWREFRQGRIAIR